MNKKIILATIIGFFIFLESCKKKELLNQDLQNSLISNPTSIGIPQPEKKIIPENGKYPVMTFEKNEHNFGTINAGSKVDYSFKFKNTGETDLLISRAVGSCGCTVPEYPKTPVKAGETANIDVSFNSAGKRGNQQKSITIYTNTNSGIELLTIKASIKE